MIIIGKPQAEYIIRSPDELKAFYGSVAFGIHVLRLKRLQEEMKRRAGDKTFQVQIEATMTAANLFVYKDLKKMRVCTIQRHLVKPIMEKIFEMREQKR